MSEEVIRMYKMMPFDSFEKTLKYWALRASEPYNSVIPMENYPQFSGAMHKEKCILNAANSRFVFMSFTTNVQSPAMWGLYAERGRGVCLIFDFPKYEQDDVIIKSRFVDEGDSFNKNDDNKANREGSFYLKKITYRSDDKRYKFYNDKAIKTLEGQKALLLNKPKSCSFEEEYRIIKTSVESSLYFSEGCMFRTPMEYFRGVVVGPLFPKSPEIIRAMFKMYRKNYFAQIGYKDYKPADLILKVSRAENDTKEFKYIINGN